MNRIDKMKEKREVQKIIGKNIGKWMLENEMNQIELSMAVDIHPVAVSRYVQGHVLPGTISLYRIAKALNCTMEDLMEGVEI